MGAMPIGTHTTKVNTHIRIEAARLGTTREELFMNSLPWMTCRLRVESAFRSTRTSPVSLLEEVIANPLPSRHPVESRSRPHRLTVFKDSTLSLKITRCYAFSSGTVLRAPQVGQHRPLILLGTKLVSPSKTILIHAPDLFILPNAPQKRRSVQRRLISHWIDGTATCSTAVKQNNTFPFHCDIVNMNKQIPLGIIFDKHSIR